MRLWESKKRLLVARGEGELNGEILEKEKK